MSVIKDFQSIYRQGGAACLCVDYLRAKYNIGYLTEEQAQQATFKAQQATFISSMGKLLPDVIKEAETALKLDFGELQEEITDGLQRCVDSKSKENYCYRMLQPFGFLNDFIRVYRPTGIVNHYKQSIKELENEKAQKKAHFSDKKVFQSTDFEEEIKALEYNIALYQKELEKIESNKDKFYWLLQADERGQFIEDDWVDCYRTFTNRFRYFGIVVDWGLMLNEIDLLRLQEQWGIYIISGRCWADYMDIAGSPDMAKRTIENFAPKFSFPVELDKPDIKADFQKMIEAGYIVENKDGGYIWQKPYPRVLCAYFCKQMSEKYELSKKMMENGKKAINWKPFESVFGYESGKLKSDMQSWNKEHSTDYFFPNGAGNIDELLF